VSECSQLAVSANPVTVSITLNSGESPRVAVHKNDEIAKKIEDPYKK